MNLPAEAWIPHPCYPCVRALYLDYLQPEGTLCTSGLVYKDIFQAPPCDSATVYIPGAFPPPNQTFAGARSKLRPPTPLSSGHISAGRNSRACDSRVLAAVSQQGTRRCSGTESHAQHSAGMPHSAASFLTGTTVLFLVEKDAPRGSERSGETPPDGGDRSYIRPLSTEARMLQSEQITRFPLRQRKTCILMLLPNHNHVFVSHQNKIVT